MPKDFSHQNLRGCSFKGQNFTGANFSGADIRGANFTGANLTLANFSHTQAGLQKRWVIGLVVMSCLLSGISGYFSGYAGSFFSILLTNSPTNITNYITILSIVLVLFVTARQGLVAGLGAFIFYFVFAFAFARPFNVTLGATLSLGGAFSFFFAAAGALAGVFAFSLVFAVAEIRARILVLAVIIAGTLAAGILTEAVAESFAGSGAITLLSIYIAWRALKEDKKYAFIRNIAVAFAAFGGTSFRNADLTDAVFTAATLKNTDLRKAILTRTCFNKTKKLDLVRFGTTYLQKAQVISVLVAGQGQDKNFDREDLRGVNFRGANLADASFIGANLSEANLQNADLSRAKLVQTQLDGTDFTGATLTGVYIEDWGITTDTKFDGVRCEYVYMRLPTKENPDPHRKPDNRQEVFADGDFEDFIKPIFDTLDLYHNQGVDPRAIAISFKHLAENNPEADLRIVGMEVRGEDKFLLRAKTAIAADKSQLSAEYFATYNQLKALAEQEVKALIAEKDSRIADLQNMVVTALQRPSFYSNVEQVGFMTNNPGGFSVGGSVDGDINNVQGENNQQRVSNKSSSFNLQSAQFAGGVVNADTVNAHQIGGNITNYNPEQKQNLAEAAADIQQLLNQLGQSYPINTPLEKQIAVTEALKQIDNNPTLKARVIGALKAGGTEALKELVDHPLVNILLATLEGWQDAE
ncbi:pentapeptide repeat-containing protein [Nostoc sp.]|uniref:pentapeptide repeat-containing protein n=1 Tax=Nostoc sp. TaxID=1180 RepID=UPI002FFA85D6